MAKCVMVLEEGLSPGLAVNTAGVLAFTLGRELGDVVGPSVVDGSGGSHLGITTVPIPILGAGRGEIGAIRARAAEADLLVVDFTDAAQTSKTYEQYTRKMAAVASEELRYLGIALYGDRKTVSSLTGSLPLLG